MRSEDVGPLYGAVHGAVARWHCGTLNPQPSISHLPSSSPHTPHPTTLTPLTPHPSPPHPSAALVWRHCPFGLHTLLDPTPKLPQQHYVYVTMMREPLARMISWFAYCDKYSPNKCNAGKAFDSQVGRSVEDRVR